VADVIKVLAEKGDEWRHVLDPQRLTITVNKQFSSVGQKLSNGDEIAFVPKA
jgi:molybdopterin converting factor small subunit